MILKYKNKFLFILIYSLFLLILFITIGEITFRILFSDIKYRTVEYQFSKEFGHTLKPNLDTHFIRDDFSTTIKTNSDGFREKEFLLSYV